VIYVTLNSSEPPQVKMPNLIDVSYRQAVSILLSFGLKEGQISYKPDLAKNIVLKQLYNGQPVLPETKVLKGSSIDLVLGDGLGSTEIDVPELATLLTKKPCLFCKVQV
jgi:beta-lactam-binding protein with PASTA domain